LSKPLVLGSRSVSLSDTTSVAIPLRSTGRSLLDHLAPGQSLVATVVIKSGGHTRSFSARIVKPEGHRGKPARHPKGRRG
jgi:hypothetical protein